MISRRAFVAGAVALLAWPRRPQAGTPAPPMPGLVDAEGVVAPELARAFDQMDYAYVSPLRSDGKASTCHGEVWFAWHDGAIFTTTSKKSWKARAIDAGLGKARLWFGNYGRWKHPGGNNEAFRRGPNFEARAARVEDSGLLDRILATYEKKYPAEIGRWRDRMRREVASGERVILRYQPLPSPPALKKPAKPEPGASG